MTPQLALVRNEVRALWPLAVACGGVVAVAGVLDAPWRGVGFLTYLVGSMGLGASVIGHELNHATLGSLLVQPVARRRVLAAKYLVAAVALAGLGAVASAGGHLDDLVVPGSSWRHVVPLLVLSTALFVAPWLTMLARNAVAGAVGALLIPVAMFFALGLVDFHRYVGAGPLQVRAWVVVLLSATAGLWGWQLFTHRLEDVASSAGQIHLRLWGRTESAGLGTGPAGPPRKLQQLVGKEIRLQQLPIVVASLYLAAALFAEFTTGIVPTWLDPRQGYLIAMYGAATALLIGAVASAEERQLGTLPWQVIVPVRVWQQFLLKTVVAVVLSVLLTSVMPGLVALTLTTPSAAAWLPEYGLVMAALTVVGLYVSSLSTSSLRAFLMALPVVVALGAFVGLEESVFRPMGLSLFNVVRPGLGAGPADAWDLTARAVERLEWFAYAVLGAALAAMVWRFALTNHSKAERSGRRAIRQAVSAGSALFVGTVTIFFLLAAIDFARDTRGAISGVLVDEAGEPVPNVSVRASEVRYLTGRRRLVQVSRQSLTDDRGRFRIDRLESGSYYLSAVTGAFLAFDAPGDFAPTFYPGTTDINSARSVAVNARAETANVSFPLVPAPMAQLAGRLVDEDGQPVGQGTVWFSPTDPETGLAPMLRARGRSDSDGDFSFRNVPPGSYVVQAYGHRVDFKTAMPRPFGWRQVTTNGESRTDVTITVASGAVLRGRILFDGDSPRPLPNQFRIRMRTVAFGSSPVSIGTPPQVIGDDWTFEVNALSGLRVVRISDYVASTWRLRAVRLDGRDITDTPLDFRPGDDIEGVEVVMTDRTAALTGSVPDQAGPPSRTHSIVVFSSDANLWRFPSRHLYRVRPDATGAFRTPALLPGEYLVLALSAVDFYEWEDPEFLDGLRPLATPVTVEAGAAVELSLSIVR